MLVWECWNLDGAKDLLRCKEIPYWYPPELLTSEIDSKFDIWSIGILALELGLGRPVAVPPQASQEFIKLATERLGMEKSFYVEYGVKRKEFTMEFQRLVRSCLSEAASDRPSAEELMSSGFLIDCHGPDTLQDIENKIRCQKEKQKDDDKKRIVTGWKIHDKKFMLVPHHGSRELLLLKQNHLKAKWELEDDKDVLMSAELLLALVPFDEMSLRKRKRCSSSGAAEPGEGTS